MDASRYARLDIFVFFLSLLYVRTINTRLVFHFISFSPHQQREIRYIYFCLFFFPVQQTTREIGDRVIKYFFRVVSNLGTPEYEKQQQQTTTTVIMSLPNPPTLELTDHPCYFPVVERVVCYKSVLEDHPLPYSGPNEPIRRVSTRQFRSEESDFLCQRQQRYYLFPSNVNSACFQLKPTLKPECPASPEFFGKKRLSLGLEPTTIFSFGPY